MKIEKEMTHPMHPRHKLRLEYTEIPYNCDGCKEAGIGYKYKCQQCGFNLHKVCAVGAPRITHPFYEKCEFKLYYYPPGRGKRVCDACRTYVNGFVYHCNSCDFDLHPCCANLPQVLDDGKHNLYLCNKLSSSCHSCGGKGLGWSYRSQCKTYNLHLSCVKEMLVESWQAIYFNVDKNKVRQMHTSIPSLKGSLQNRPGARGTVKKYGQMAGTAARAIVSAILDPCLYALWNEGSCGALGNVVFVSLNCVGNVVMWVVLMVYFYDCKREFLEKKVDLENNQKKAAEAVQQ